MFNYMYFLLLFLFPSITFANNLECYEEPGTLKTMCIQPSSVRMNGNIRSSPIFMGGPKNVSPTTFLLITDCMKKITTLQDRDGQNFAGGKANQTTALQSLSTWVCEVKSPKKNSSLRQF